MNIPSISTLFGLLSALTVCACSSGDVAAPAIPQDKELERRVEKTLGAMSIEEKAGQMVQISLEVLTGRGQTIDGEALDRIIAQDKVGSILNIPGSRSVSSAEMAEIVRQIQEKSMEAIGIPCIYGLDMIHGASYLTDGTLFPQEVNIAASFNPEYAAAMGKAIAYETRAAMVPWVFSPVMDLARHSAWPRLWESWGEDPYLQTVMSLAETRAMQGDDPNHLDLEHVSASVKHYMGYGAPVTGKDRTPAYITPQDLKEKFFPPFKACIEAGALNLMANSGAVNGVPVHSSRELLTEWLKEGLNWDGMIVSDWADINNLYQRDHIAADRKEAVMLAVNAGVDMIMDPYESSTAGFIVELVREGLISQARLDDAVRRILRMKYRLGLFDNPTWDVSGYEMGREEFVSASRDAAVESMVLLKNENSVLPLRKGSRILLTGPNANSMRAIDGGWSYTWQGCSDPYYVDRFNTVYEAMCAKFGASKVTLAEGVKYVEGGNFEAENADGISAALRAAAACDVIVACIGENSYCETPGNIADLTLSANQLRLVRGLAASGKPVVLVIGGGRPRVVSSIEPLASAVVETMLPGPYGADALAELLAGEKNFSGKLPFTYPKYVNSIHTYDYKVSESRETMAGEYNYDAVLDVQWPFGYGLSYTTFDYSNLRVDKTEFDSGDILKVSVDVSNSGSVAGKESVLVYSSDLVASLMPDVKRLRAFTKVELAPGETRSVTLEIPARSLAFVGTDLKWRLEEGDFRISVGGLSTLVRCSCTDIWD